MPPGVRRQRQCDGPPALDDFPALLENPRAGGVHVRERPLLAALKIHHRDKAFRPAQAALSTGGGNIGWQSGSSQASDGAMAVSAPGCRQVQARP